MEEDGVSFGQVWAEDRDPREDRGEMVVVERGEWVTSPREKEHKAPGQKLQTPTLKVWRRAWRQDQE